MKIRLMDIACTRSGDKGDSSNIGIVFEHQDVYDWAVENLTSELIKSHLDGIAKEDVIRYKLPNLLALNEVNVFSSSCVTASPSFLPSAFSSAALRFGSGISTTSPQTEPAAKTTNKINTEIRFISITFNLKSHDVFL